MIGGGGREHALVWKLAQSPHVSQIICAPGNGGTAREKKCRNVDIAATDKWELISLAEQERFDLTVVGPEAPLVAGIVDDWPLGLSIFAPRAGAALLEGSRSWAKKMMTRHHIPTAEYWVFDSQEAAFAWLDQQPEGKCWVVKADGLAAGKGVSVCFNRQQTKDAVFGLSAFGAAGRTFIIEELLVGKEVSLFLLCSSTGQILPLESAQDYKRVGEGDTGPNTGGMGSYSPADHLTAKMTEEIIAKLEPMLHSIRYSGFLYVGLMLTRSGWMVLEFNVRMGDPETQVVLPRLETDLAILLRVFAEGTSRWTEPLVWSPLAAVTVVMTAGGYPGDYHKGDVIAGLDLVDRINEEAPGLGKVFHAGTKLGPDGQILTAGGRVLNVTALGPTLDEAADRAHRHANIITWPGEYHRRDIARGV